MDNGNDRVRGKEGLNFIGTSHLQSTDDSSNLLFNNQLRYNYNIRMWIHNHPEGNGPSQNDVNLCREIWPYSLKMKERIKWGVYDAKGKKYIPYDHKGNKEYEGVPFSIFKNCKFLVDDKN